MKPRAAYGYGILIVGALTMVVATFLPFQRSDLYDTIQGNNLAHSWSGIFLIGLAVGSLITGYQAFHGRIARTWLATLMSLAAMVLILWIASDEDRRTLYPIGASGLVDTRQPGVVSSLAIAIYVAGAGALAALIGCLMMHGAIEPVDDDAEDHQEDDQEDEP